MNNVSALEIIEAVRNYKFPMSEPIFSCALDHKNPNIDWLGMARPINSHHYCIASFWASSLYNCLEDIGLDEHFESIGGLSILEPININIALEEITSLLKKTDDSIFTVRRLKSCYRTLKLDGFGGLMGCDLQGIFTILWQSKCLTYNPSENVIGL